MISSNIMIYRLPRVCEFVCLTHCAINLLFCTFTRLNFVRLILITIDNTTRAQHKKILWQSCNDKIIQSQTTTPGGVGVRFSYRFLRYQPISSKFYLFSHEKHRRCISLTVFYELWRRIKKKRTKFSQFHNGCMRYIQFIYFCFSRCLVFLLRAHHVLMYVLINFTFARNQWSVKTKFISHFTIHWRFTYRVFFSSPSFFFHFRLKLPRQISMDTWIHCNNNKNHMMKKLIRFLFGIAKGTRQPAYRIMTLDTSHWKAIGYNRPNELNCCYIWPKWVSSWQCSMPIHTQTQSESRTRKP